MDANRINVANKNRLETFTSKWYFFVLLLLAQFIIMPFATRNFNPQQMGQIITVTLDNAPQTHLGNFNIVFQALSVIMILLVVVMKNNVGRIFSGYVALSYLIFAIIQNIAITELYGFSIVTVNVLMFLFVAYAWIREAFRPENSYSFSNLSRRHCWMILLSLFAFYCPFDMQGQLDFNPIHFMTRNTASAFCMTTPLFLTIMTLNLPNVNIATYRITAIIGFIIGIYNMAPFADSQTVWVGFLHLPLLLISLYCIVVSYKSTKGRR